MTDHVDVMVIGAGIVGLATARAIQQRNPGITLAVLDKEDRIGAHQTGHNSGVIHAGVYYKPGSAKARLCRDGRVEMLRYCEERGIATEVCGKVIVATDAGEHERLTVLAARAEANGLEIRRLDRRELAELEPHASGVAAIHVPATGIVDFAAVARALADDVIAAGASLRLGAAVVDLRDPAVGPVQIETTGGTVTADSVVACAGLHSDRIARLAGATGDSGTGDTIGGRPTILPFRGEYLELRPERRYLCRNLIYPVPDPDLPFLGVHLTRDIGGGVHAGPNAVPALGREAYDWGTFVPRDVLEIARQRSTWTLGRRYWRTEVAEVTRSLWRARFVKALQRLVPDVRAEDLVAAGSGVRAQAVAADGTLLDDFAFARTARTVHIINAPSPAATASLAIGASIADRVSPLLTVATT